jgi:hypothetical protein
MYNFLNSLQYYFVIMNYGFRHEHLTRHKYKPINTVTIKKHRTSTSLYINKTSKLKIKIYQNIYMCI